MGSGTFLEFNNDVQQQLDHADVNIKNDPAVKDIEAVANRLKSAHNNDHEQPYLWTESWLRQHMANFLYWKVREQKWVQIKPEVRKPLKILLQALRLGDAAKAAEGLEPLKQEALKQQQDGVPNFPDALAADAGAEQKKQYQQQCYSAILYHYLKSSLGIWDEYIYFLQETLKKKRDYYVDKSLALPDLADAQQVPEVLSKQVALNFPEESPQGFWWRLLEDIKTRKQQEEEKCEEQEGEQKGEEEREEKGREAEYTLRDLEQLKRLEWDQFNENFVVEGDGQVVFSEELKTLIKKIFYFWNRDALYQNSKNLTDINIQLLKGHAGPAIDITADTLWANSITYIDEWNAQRRQQLNADPIDINRQLKLLLTIERQRKKLAKWNIFTENGRQQRQFRQTLKTIVDERKKHPKISEALEAHHQWRKFEKKLNKVKQRAQHYQEDGASGFFEASLERKQATSKLLDEIEKLGKMHAKNDVIAPEQASRGLRKLKKALQHLYNAAEEDDKMGVLGYLGFFRHLFPKGRAKRLADNSRSEIKALLKVMPHYEYKRLKKARKKFKEEINQWKRQKGSDEAKTQAKAMKKLYTAAPQQDPMQAEADWYYALKEHRQQLTNWDLFPRCIRRHTSWRNRRDIIDNARDAIKQHVQRNHLLWHKVKLTKYALRQNKQFENIIISLFFQGFLQKINILIPNA